MKWFTATNESSLRNDQFFDQLKVAILSAKKNTSLTPYLIYDGNDVDRIEWLKREGVNIIYHRLSIYPAIEKYMISKYDPDLLNVRAGAYLRSEIPLAMKSNDMDDEYILYTDCDVVFNHNPKLNNIHPKYFAACGTREGGRTRFRIGGWMHYNSGVMLMNVHNLYKEFERFRDFVLNNGYDKKRPNSSFWQKNLFLSDQIAYNLFFENEILNLKSIYNWHPSSGINEEALIIHFNGLKWTQWGEFIENKLRPEVMDKFTKLVNRDFKSYEYYVKKAKEYLDVKESLV